ncbi:hypothetical protein DID78_03740 [Candidatus Marinamargulisbacteria bacterium SCGC AG-343-D04]|nr:hypothetical protein DID78_03740 [Candidatus Marinamargulisbacteria bacterium SCGC AG-343-D04]
MLSMKLLKTIISLLLFTQTLFSIEELPKAFEYSKVVDKLNATVSSNVTLIDHLGNNVEFSQFLGEKPLLLNFAYYSCPRLCHFLISGMLDSLLKLNQSDIEKIRIVTISFDHRDTQVSMNLFRDKYYQRLVDRFGEVVDWTFLRGGDVSLKKISGSVGFNYYFNPKSQQYSHPSVLTFLSPEGVVTRYVNGIVFDPLDLRLSILESAKNKVLSTVDSLLLFCYNYDPDENSYVVHAMKLMRIAGAVTVLTLFLLIIFLNKRKN